VFVEIHADRIDVVSPGRLFGDVTMNSLGRKCARRNPLIADLLQRVGVIEKAGTGIGRMRKDARLHGSPEPTFEAQEFFTATFRPLRSMEFEGLSLDHSEGYPSVGGAHDEAHEAHDEAHEAHDEAHEAHEGPNIIRINDTERTILQACLDDAVTREYLIQFGAFATRSGSFKRALARLLAEQLVEMTRPQAPRSRNQRYRATAKGRGILDMK
jgi:ATP-dependent DNA helicase RecG